MEVNRGVIVSVAILALVALYPAIRAELVGETEEERPDEPARTDGYTVVVLPDTQKYSAAYPEIFMNQTQWIKSVKDRLNVAFVVQEGDLVDHASNEEEWRRANESMSVLDGVVPYSVLPGNHDQPTRLYERYFPASRYSGYPWYGGSHGGYNDSYQLFSAGGRDYLVLNLGFCPGNKSIGWGNSVLRSHESRRAIVVTHGFIDVNGERRIYGCDRIQDVWDDLVAPNGNVFLVLSGHIHGEGRRSDEAGGRVVHQLLADYQDYPEGGQGWLRLLEFSRDGKTLNVRTYSPYLERFKTDAESQFTLEIN